MREHGKEKKGGREIKVGKQKRKERDREKEIKLEREREKRGGG